MKTASLTGRAAVVSFALLFSFLLAWHLATRGSGTVQHMDPEYAKLMGATATQGKSAMPGPIDVGAKFWEHLRRPFYNNGPNDKGVGIQLAYSIARVLTGYLLAMLVAIPVGFLIGMSPLMSKRSIRSFRCSSRSHRSPGCRSRSTPSRTRACRRSS
jgi:nitrate/nitrite transport system permease protein